MVTVALITLITAIILVRYGAFNNVVLLKSQAYEMALDIREAQTNALSVRSTGTEYRQAFGVYFSQLTPNKYQLYLDSSGNGSYDTGEERDVPYLIDARFAVSDICINGCTVSVESLSVAFIRPDFDAHFYSNDYGGTITDAEITISSITDGGSSRAVIINPVGQIEVQ